MRISARLLRVLRGILEYLGFKKIVDPALQPNVTIGQFHGSSLLPLDAHAAVKWRSSDDEKLVYLGGCQVNLELWHDGLGSGSIHLTELNIEVIEFTKKSIDELNEKPKGDNIFAEGTAKSYRFDAIINGYVVENIRWIIGGSSSTFQMARRPPNILSVESFDESKNDVLLLNDPSDPIFFKGTIRLDAPGMYRLRFSIESSVFGERNITVKSDEFLLYMRS